jgi:hypothetical protein
LADHRGWEGGNPPKTSSRRLLLSVLGGVTALPLMTVGCGTGSGVSAGAEVSVYVSRPLCADARRELAKHDEAGGVRVRAVCLRGAERAGGRLDLARVGAEARRATEDSASVAFVEPPGPESSYSRPILDQADVALVVDRSGADAIGVVLGALAARGGDESPREAVATAGP